MRLTVLSSRPARCWLASRRRARRERKMTTLKTTKDIPGYDAKATFFTAYDGQPVTYEMSYTDGTCLNPWTGEVIGYHCWHRGIGPEGDAFCCKCNAQRPPMPNEPSH